MLDRRLNHVVAVAHSGSFTKAAEKAGITQSGITKSIADLERELGYPLFYRTARGAMQTEAGREFVDRAVRLLEDARTLLTGDREGNDPYAQALRIGVCPASLEWLLAAPLATLLARHPAIRFEIVGSSFERAIQLLRTGTVDVAVGFDDAFSEWSELKRSPVGALRAVPFVRKDHPILAIAEPGQADLALYDFVVPSDSRPYGGVVRAVYENAGVFHWQRHVHMIDSFPIVKRVVATSDAIGVTTVEYSGTESFSAFYSRVPGESLFAPAPMCCAVRSRWEPSRAVKAFLRAMRDKVPLEA
ncbi:LysR family transcriptional regulator [Sphingomonas bacterium]|uniref:LysR family transcriptional regulator n=1 Tax=Sphingomonas bacterium TaxID=1895847 RepID=UPI001575DF6D|nr:LysR family transcriptional regulator [Sphingomonas bacterium]